MELVYSANECELAQLKRLQDDSGAQCESFYALVGQIQESAKHTYRVTAFGAVRQSDPKVAADLWLKMVKYCQSGLTIIQKLKEDLPQCGAIDLYNLLLYYREEAQERYIQDLQDSECVDPKIEKLLFPQMKPAS